MKEKISDLIKKQYTVYPYPPIPLGTLEEEVLYSTNYEFVNYLCTSIYKPHKNIKILDVGCGTGFSTLKLAQQNPLASITAIDISSASIKIAKERLKTAGIKANRVNFIEADLMLLKNMDEQFDYIVCTGVLHHMESPKKGLNFIKKHLKEDGIIYLMLYSEYGRYYQRLMRKAINLFQTNKNNIKEGIAIGKEILTILPEGHPILSRYQRSYQASLNVINKEFADSESQFVDAYINAKERTYNIDELFDFIESNGLCFLRFQDELQWDLKHLLYGSEYLISKTEKFSKKEKYKIGEIIESEKNFAFFASKVNFKKKKFRTEALLNFKIKLTNLNKEILSNETKKTNKYTLISPLGLSIVLDKYLYGAYQLLEDCYTIEANFTNYQKTQHTKLTNGEYIAFIKMMEEKGFIMLYN